ncbi:MAG TPA: hypothetical protein VGV86_13400 [Acidimicrobiales bacterium]|nr:hypothetical protein [Acidimicrobiales bacterium]
MPRIDIELTSSRPDGTWTWRAAGARQPKGVVAASVLYDGAKVGDVLKAEADFDLDGINVTSVAAPKAKKAAPEVLPLLGSGKEEALVTHSPLKPEREGGDRGRRGDRNDRFGGDRFGSGRTGGPGGAGGPGGPGGRGGPGGPGGRGLPGGPGATRPRATPGPGAGPRDGARREGGGTAGPGQRERVRPDRPERPRGERPAGDRSPREGGGREGSGREGGGREGGGRDRREGSDRPRSESGRPPREGAGRDRPPRAPGGAGPGRNRPPAKRIQAGRAHRDAVLAALPPEQRAIAEQVMRGGLAGVRQAVEEQNTQARAAGGPEIRSEAILALAEELLPSLRAAEWRDRAEAAAAIVDEIGLRDLRTVVAGSDAAGRDEESRALATRLREGLERRSAAERQTWMDEIATCLTEGRVVRAVRVSSRAPEQGLRLPPELSTGLSAAVADAMSSETAPDRWLALLEAVLASPIRRTIVPKGLPAGADEETLKTIRQSISKVPALGPLLGESPSSRPVPPPPPRRPPAPPAAAPAPVASAPEDPAAAAAPQEASLPEPEPAVPTEPEPAVAEPEAAVLAEPEADAGDAPEGATD